MTDLSFPRPERDFKAEKICDPCWNNKHWRTSKEQGMKTVVIWDCMGGLCECNCRALYREQTAKRKRVKPDYSQQSVIDTGNDVLEFGVKNEHEDRG